MFSGSAVKVAMSDQDSYKVKDLAGCQVFTLEGEPLGSLVDVLPAGGNDVFVIQREKQEILIPALKTVVRSIDLAARRIEVDLPKGLRAVYES